MTATDVNATEHTITARTRKQCHTGNSTNCIRWIEPGNDYVRIVAFPGHDAYSVPRGSRPWVMVICLHCWRWSDDDRPLPPRRARRRR